MVSERQEYPNIKNIIYAGCAFLMIIFIIILVPMSFIYVHYDQMGFVSNTFTNTVNVNRVLVGPGTFYKLPHERFVAFKSTYQPINMTNLAVADKDQKRFYLTITFYYKLSSELLPQLYNHWETNYKSQIESVTESTIKDIAPLFTIDEYLKERTNITETFARYVKKKLERSYIEMDIAKFFLQKITLESTTAKKFLSNVIQDQNNEMNLAERVADLIRSNTTRLVEEINAKIIVIKQTASSQVDQMIINAKADALKIVNIATGNGIRHVANRLNITTTDDLDKLIKYMSIAENPDLKLLNIDQNTNIIIN